MAHGYIIEKRISAKDVEALNRTAIADVNIDGGERVSLTYKGDGVWTATKDESGEWVAYNPSEHFTEVDGKLYAGLSKDPRAYTNLKGRPLDVFKVQDVDVIGYVVPKETEGATYKGFTVIGTESISFPQAGIGEEKAKVLLVSLA